ncbi:MAG: ABC transporter permease [Kiritimatiellae bacterium]|nr:ABC transporter permease [Kiritimatiellia bacterium]
MPETRTQQRKTSILDTVFGAVLGLYILFIGGIVVANALVVGMTPEGRLQFWESIRDPDVLHAVWLSIWTSTVSAIIAMGISIPSGYLLSHRRSRGMRFIDAIVDIPIILPPLLFGISLLVLFQRTFLGASLRAIGLKFYHEPSGIVLVQVLIAAAYGIRMLKGAFDSLDPRLAAVARTLGCTRLRAFLTVVLPSIRNSIIAALVMIWARALALYGPIIAFVGATTGRTEVLPTRMYLEMSVGRLEAALAVSLLMIGLAAIVLLILKLVGGSDGIDSERMTRL